MSEFDEWFKSLNEGGRATYFLGQEGNISKEAWNHQQAKIDELKMSNHHLSVQLADSNAHYDHVKKERDELQKKYDELNNRATGIALDQMATAKLNYELQVRIDSALNTLCKLQYSSGERIYSDVGSILKGNKDEN